MKKLKQCFGGKVFLFEHFRASDRRGSFSKHWVDGAKAFKVGEIFSSFSKKGVLRGLHYILAPQTQSRMVFCLSGRVKDVVVDIRKGSPTYGKHVSVELSAEKNTAIFIGKGFAHGFLALEDSLLLYLADKPYFAKSDRGIKWNDPALGIKWGAKKPVVSERDAAFPLLADAENNFNYLKKK